MGIAPVSIMLRLRTHLKEQARESFLKQLSRVLWSVPEEKEDGGKSESGEGDYRVHTLWTLQSENCHIDTQH